MDSEITPAEQLKSYSFEGQVLLLYNISLVFSPDTTEAKHRKQAERFIKKAEKAFSIFVEKSLFQEARETFVRQQSPWGSPWEASFNGKIELRENIVSASFTSAIKKGKKLYTQAWQADLGSVFNIRPVA
ncbi:MAG: hypothetical protein IKD06_00905 [Clostridia bacterium]|nr:hypothetical protein [Clostridia bacterium]